MATGAGLSVEEVQALVRRYVDGEPGLLRVELRGGLGCLCRAVFDDEAAPRWLFTVAMEGGVLVRLPEEARDRIVSNRVGVANAALPDWVVRLQPSSAAQPDPALERVRATADRDTHGTPDEWVWVPLADAEAFERRKPHIREALEFCRHRMTAKRR